jgi:hypothetical protein
MDAVSGMRLDDHTILIRTLKSGHIERGKATTYRDGKTLRVEFFTLDGNSNGVKTIATFHKQ